MSIECKVPECGNPVFSTGLCRKHYERGEVGNSLSLFYFWVRKKSYRGVLCITHYRLVYSLWTYVERNYLTTSNTPDIQCAPG